MKHIRALPMLTSMMTKHWVILAPKDCCREVDAFAQTLEKVAQEMTYSLPKPAM